jgi:hypothetical protein
VLTPSERTEEDAMDLWSYPKDAEQDVSLVGYDVVAIDGSIGKVDEATYDAGESCVVVDTGFWIFGKKRVLPAGVIDRIDPQDEKVYVNRTKAQVKDAPDWDEGRWHMDDYRNQLGDYYNAS